MTADYFYGILHIMFSIQRNTGLIKFIILIVILIIVLSYFNIDIRGIIETPQTQENLSYVWGVVIFVWTEYLSSPVLYFWNNIFIDLLWESFVSNLERIKAGEPHDFELNAPRVPGVEEQTI